MQLHWAFLFMFVFSRTLAGAVVMGAESYCQIGQHVIVNPSSCQIVYDEYGVPGQNGSVRASSAGAYEDGWSWTTVEVERNSGAGAIYREARADATLRLSLATLGPKRTGLLRLFSSSYIEHFDDTAGDPTYLEVIIGPLRWIRGENCFGCGDSDPETVSFTLGERFEVILRASIGTAGVDNVYQYIRANTYIDFDFSEADGVTVPLLPSGAGSRTFSGYAVCHRLPHVRD